MKIILAIPFLLFSSLFYAQTANFEVKVENIKNTGTLYLGVYQKDNFLKKATYERKLEVKESDESVSFEFKDIPVGNYGFMLLLDENNNQEMDFNLIGIPKEQYGYSNNKFLMREPVFEDVSFLVELQTTEVLIELK
ncbi:DUF2141 domain-containing protein [Mesonia sp. K7]|uniref:DUF2141 domain-containing protein n=1 Tax=Mesonia sp. K7 TaxID=2218606 RepID=UPI000DAA6031|nr:DUF2141 domain-containing protein [Mesonia sp. K7]PZD77300.1 DUF2141 domain-containing protein [Mesonia sp. K7]